MIVKALGKVLPRVISPFVAENYGARFSQGGNRWRSQEGAEGTAEAVPSSLFLPRKGGGDEFRWRRGRP